MAKALPDCDGVWLTGSAETSVSVFNPETGTYAVSPSPLLWNYMDKASVVHRGRIFLLGGPNDSTAAVLDGPDERWKKISSLPSGNQCRGVVAQVCGDDLFALGGSFNTTVKQDVYRYDDEHDAWINQDCDMPTARFLCGQAVLGSRIHVVGGFDRGDNPSSVHEGYDPRAKQWQTLPPAPVGFGACSSAALNDTLYIAAGRVGCRELDDAFRFDPRANRWETLPRLPTAVGESSGLALDGKFRVYGGNINGVGAVDYVQEFDPQSQTWEFLEPMDATRSRGTVVLYSLPSC